MKVVQSNINFNVAEFYNNKHISLIIDSNSNIGVGISNPQGLLHLHKPLNDTDVTVKLTDANNTTGVVLKKDSNQDFYISNTHSNGNIIFNTSNNEKIRINYAGKIGIGTNNPIDLLDIRGGNIRIEGNILPNTNISYDLGSLTNRWKDLYLSGNSINLGGLILTKSSTNNLQIKDENGNI
ncbi:MAG: hypothetical protein EBS95_12525, partial [Chitinophagia bacterium]|nr:hypothetical protein [Chitinophagia bacterium]